MSERPSVLKGIAPRFNGGCGKIFINVNGLGGKPYEVFISNKSGCTALTEGLVRVVSLYLREGGTPEKVVEQLKNVPCIKTKNTAKVNCARAIALALLEYEHAEKTTRETDTKVSTPKES